MHKLHIDESWELYGDEKIQLYAWEWHFKKFFTKKLGVLRGAFKGFDVRKMPRRPTG